MSDIFSTTAATNPLGGEITSFYLTAEAARVEALTLSIQDTMGRIGSRRTKIDTPLESFEIHPEELSLVR